jgi:hypothetical protein
MNRESAGHVPYLMLLVMLVAGVCQPAVAQQRSACPIQLRDVTHATGIKFAHTDGSYGKRFIVETVTAGLALFDYDNDGWVDIYFVNGAPTDGAPTPPSPPRNALYRNEGNWHFTDVTEQAGVGDAGFGLGVATADFDNDGDQDIYVNNFGPNVLYQNNGDGTFSEITPSAGVSAGNMMGAGACFLDIEGDGDLDLYCANYCDFTYDKHVDFFVGGYPNYRGPKDYQPEPDMLFRNNGDATFSDVSAAAGVAHHPGSGMGMICLDYDNDADTDVVVMNDVAGNFLFQNDGSGRFDEVGLLAGISFNVDGEALGSMGSDCGDYDNDGWLDLFQTSYAGELPALFHNTGIGFFEDVTRTTGAGSGTLPHVNWGIAFADFDNNGYRDIFIANGHIQDNIEQYSGTTVYEPRNTLLMNTGTGRFVDVSAGCGDGLLVERSSRGVGVDDLDKDGLVDVVILNSRRESTLLKNVSSTKGHWIQVGLIGTRANRDGVGAHVRVKAGNLLLMAEVHSGRGYQSDFGRKLQFGLNDEPNIDWIEVRWIGGAIERFESPGVDNLIMLVEGDGTPVH